MINNSYKAFPPSISSTPVYSASIPTFGSQVVHTVTDSFVSLFRGVFVGSFGAIFTILSFFAAVIAKFTGLFGAVPSMWPARSSSTAEYSIGPSAVPTGAEFAI